MKQITNNQNQKLKEKIIYSKKVCEQLIGMGFRPIDTFPNPLKPEFMCWAFDWTDEFDTVLSEILPQFNQKGGCGK